MANKKTVKKNAAAKPVKKTISQKTVAGRAVKKQPAAEKTVAKPMASPSVSAPAERSSYSILPTTTRSFSPAVCIIGDSKLRIFGRTPAERLKLQFSREGTTKIIAPEDVAQHSGPIVFASGECVLDQPLVSALLKRPNLAITTEQADGGKVLAANVRAADAPAALAAIQHGTTLKAAGVLQRAPSEMEANFWQALRKRETPYALHLNAENVAAIEWRTFMGTYKGATDLVTKHVWPRPAFAATRWLAPRGITPNMVTTVGALMTIAAFFLFLYGHYAIGLVAAWTMTFLDTVDGKLARTTLTSSKWGDVFDHGIDLVHPPFWYFAWAFGLASWGVSWSPQLYAWTLIAILGGYVVQRLMEGIAIKWLGLEIHIWRKIDTLFRQITARRNPNLILLTLFTLFGKPDWGLLAVAAWTVICLALHAVQLVQALMAKPQGEPLTSWMTKP